LKELIRGGAQLVQIRDKSTPARELALDLNRCVEYALKHGVALIVNDRCDLALCCRTDGVHLGQHDLPPKMARSIVGRNMIMGFSTHTLAQVRQCSAFPIQYIGFGPVYDTSTKPDAEATTGLHRLAKAARISAFPLVAIGGIGLERVTEVLRAGADSAAVVSGLMKAPSIAREMEKFLKKAREK
jgi:thiamine-phosphate pyrophosphorylase